MFTSQNIQKRNPIPKEKKKKKRMLITPLIVKKEKKTKLKKETKLNEIKKKRF